MWRISIKAPERLNPLFIRSSIPFLVPGEGIKKEKPPSLNPLFIRSSIPLGLSPPHIPLGTASSQSLIHQVIYSVSTAGVQSEGESMSQSLIHQVIYSVGMVFGWRRSACHVSIPYSSGHLFRSSASMKQFGKGFVSIPYSSGHLFRSFKSNYLKAS